MNYLLQDGIFFLIHLFARDILVMTNFEIEKPKPIYTISVLKVENKVVLVSSISNFFTNKTSLANRWMSFSSSNSALFETKNKMVLPHLFSLNKYFFHFYDKTNSHHSNLALIEKSRIAI